MAKKRLKNIGIGVGVLALVGAVGAGVTESVKEATKSTVTRTITWVQERYEQVFPSELPQANKKAAFSIFVAKLDGDADGLQTRHVLESLRRSFDATDAQSRIEVREIGRVLKEGSSGDVFEDHQRAIKIGKEWLKQSGAHVLIWGHVAERNKALRIYFLQGEDLLVPLGIENKRPSETYALTERLQLSEDFGEDLGLVIAVRAFALVTPWGGNLLQKQSPVGLEMYQRVKGIARLKLLSQTKAGCQLRSALGEMVMCWSFPFGSVGLLGAADDDMVEAIKIFQDVLGDSRCVLDSEFVAQVQSQLGFAFEARGDHEKAAVAFREALKGKSPERTPDWANTQYQLAQSLMMLGKRESGTVNLEQAVAAYRAALDFVAKSSKPQYFSVEARRHLAEAEALLADRRSKGL